MNGSKLLTTCINYIKERFRTIGRNDKNWQLRKDGWDEYVVGSCFIINVQITDSKQAKIIGQHKKSTALYFIGWFCKWQVDKGDLIVKETTNTNV